LIISYVVISLNPCYFCLSVTKSFTFSITDDLFDKMKRAIILLLLMAASERAFSQAKENKITVDIGLVGLTGIRDLSNTNKLNSILSDAGYPSIKGLLTSSEAGVGIWLNQWYLLAIQKQFQLSGNSNSMYSTSGKGDGFELIFAYNIVRSSNFRVYPYAGIGYQNLVINIDPAVPPFYANLLLNPGQQSVKTTVDQENTGSVGFGFDYKIAKVFGESSFLSLGLITGYVYGGGGTWRINDQLAQKPDASFSGIDIKFSFQLVFRIK